MADESNGRVTMAVLSTKLDTLIDKVDRLSSGGQIDHDRLGKVESLAAENKETTKDLGTKLEAVDVARKWEGRAEAIAVAILAAIGIVRT